MLVTTPSSETKGTDEGGNGEASISPLSFEMECQKTFEDVENIKTKDGILRTKCWKEGLAAKASGTFHALRCRPSNWRVSPG